MGDDNDVVLSGVENRLKLISFEGICKDRGNFVLFVVLAAEVFSHHRVRSQRQQQGKAGCDDGDVD